MKKIALTALFVASAVAGGQAADLSVRSPVAKAPAVPAYDWTGLYAGVNVGYGMGHAASSFATTGAGTNVGETFTAQPAGVIGGGQIGYNWQFDWWALGVETDIQGAGLDERQTCLVFCTALLGSATIDQNLDWFGTTRGRIGLTGGTVFTYLTGGVAYGGVSTTITQTNAPAVGAFTTSATRTGWTLGNGVEAAIDGNWTAKIEYLYVNFGSSANTFALAGMTDTYVTRNQFHLFRAGLNYRFGASPQPLATRNWAGWYAGIIGGSAPARNPSSLTAPGLAEAETFYLAPRGYLGGGVLSYNWQTGRWVYGIETDFMGSFVGSDEQTCVLGCTPTAGAQIFQKNSWLGSTRGRLGYAAGDALIYATAGVAYGKIKTSVAENVTIAGGGAGNFAFSNTETGWTAGAGVENPFNPFGWFGPNWSTRTEYRFVDLGRATDTYTLAGSTHTLTTAAREHLFLAGLSYKFAN